MRSRASVGLTLALVALWADAAPPLGTNTASTFAPPPAAAVVKVAAEGFSCRSGKYAVTLATHFPSLHGIGRHQVAELETRQRDGGVTEKVYRFDYIGLRLDVRVSSTDPSRYVLLAADASSRRWNIGPLSVGTKPWRWGREKWLSQTPLEGWVELVGAGESVQLLLSDGRVDRVRYLCSISR